MTEQLKLDEGEEIKRVVRKHWFILFAKTVGLFAAAGVPMILLSLMLSSDWLRSMTPDYHLWMKPAIFLSSAWLLLVWMALFTVWTDYYLDNWIITNLRVIAIDQRGFFNRQVSSFRFERLQNTTVNIDGLLHTLLDFGDIDADTAGHEHFVIRGIPNPREIKSLMQVCADHLIKNPITPAATPPQGRASAGL